jgi:uncharacterized membrane protein YadS
MRVGCLITSFIFALLFTITASYSDRGNDKGYNYNKYVPMFVGVFVVGCILYTICIDTSEQTQMFENIKVGPSPF